jgi:hypothetical protein
MSSARKGFRYIQDVISHSYDLLKKEDYSNLRFKDIVGFDLPRGTSVFLPFVKCVPVTSLLPLYDTLVVGIPKIEKVDRFKDQTGLTFEDVIALAQKGKLILFIDVDCIMCLEEMSEVVQALVDNDVHLFLGSSQSVLLALRTAEPVGVDYRQGIELSKAFSRATENEEERKKREKAELVIKVNLEGKASSEVYRSTPYTRISACVKPTAEYVRQLIDMAKKGEPRDYIESLAERLYMIPKFLLAKAFNSTLSTNVGCRYLPKGGYSNEILVNRESVEEIDPYKLEFVEKKLHIAYSESLPLVEYGDIFDSKTTSSMRNIFEKTIKEASSKGSSLVSLQNAVDEYNRQVEELMSRSTGRTKIVYATTDILRANAGAIRMLMEGAMEKYANAPHKAWDCFIVPKRYRSAISRWLSEKAVKLESRLAGVSPDVIHLYHTRTCVDRLAQASKIHRSNVE